MKTHEKYCFMLRAGIKRVMMAAPMKLPILGMALLIGGVVVANSGGAGIKVLLADPDGDWQVSGRTVDVGNPPKSLDLIIANKAGELILDCPGKGWISYSCDGPCKVPACGEQSAGFTRKRVDKGAENGSEPSRADRFLALFTRESHPPAMLGVRGSENEPNDAVVLEKEGELHLGPALIRVLEGEYCLRLQRLDAQGGPPSDLHLKWDKSEEPEGLVKAPDIKPGVYSLQRMELSGAGTCSIDPKAATAWVLVTPESDFSNLQTRWKNNRAWFAKLSDSNPAVVTTIKHAAIAELAGSLTK